MAYDDNTKDEAMINPDLVDEMEEDLDDEDEDDRLGAGEDSEESAWA